MYAWLIRRIPGPWWVRALVVVAAVVAVFFLLMEVVFPWLSGLMPYADVAV